MLHVALYDEPTCSSDTGSSYVVRTAAINVNVR